MALALQQEAMDAEQAQGSAECGEEPDAGVSTAAETQTGATGDVETGAKEDEQKGDDGTTDHAASDVAGSVPHEGRVPPPLSPTPAPQGTVARPMRSPAAYLQRSDSIRDVMNDETKPLKARVVRSTRLILDMLLGKRSLALRKIVAQSSPQPPLSSPHPSSKQELTSLLASLHDDMEAEEEEFEEDDASMAEQPATQGAVAASHSSEQETEVTQ